MAQTCYEQSTVQLKAIYRDLHSGYENNTNRNNSKRHPDCEDIICTETGLVENTLSADGTPTPSALPGACSLIKSADSWHGWYHDVSIDDHGTLGNVRVEGFVPLELQADGRTYIYNSAPLGDRGGFWPLDNRGIDDHQSEYDHNYCFTTHIRTTFTYRGDEVFQFHGDDDVWVYVNNGLVVDIGGVHRAICKYICMSYDNVCTGPADCNKVDRSGNNFVDTLIRSLVVGETYNFDMFHAERHTTQSNFYLSTTLALQGEVIDSAELAFVDTPDTAFAASVANGNNFELPVELSYIPDVDVTVTCFATDTDDITGTRRDAQFSQGQVTFTACTTCDSGCGLNYEKRKTVSMAANTPGNYYVWCEASGGVFTGASTTGSQVQIT
eukprot:Clim_evm68s119 gene=Clim_evmTU68s119